MPRVSFYLNEEQMHRIRQKLEELGLEASSAGDMVKKVLLALLERCEYY